MGTTTNKYVVQMAGESKPYKDYLPREFFRLLKGFHADVFWSFRDNIAYLESSERLDVALESLGVWAMDANTGNLIK